MKVYLDDLRKEPEGYVLVKNVKSLKELLEKERHFDVLSLDNDLGNDKLEGYDFVKWYVNQKIEGKNYEIDVFKIHSANVIASKNMKDLLRSAIKHGVIEGRLEEWR